MTSLASCCWIRGPTIRLGVRWFIIKSILGGSRSFDKIAKLYFIRISKSSHISVETSCILPAMKNNAVKTKEHQEEVIKHVMCKERFEKYFYEYKQNKMKNGLGCGAQNDNGCHLPNCWEITSSWYY